MKKISDYEGNEAIELWADLLDPVSRIIADKNILELKNSGMPVVAMIKEVLKTHAEDAIEILERIDPTPINGVTIVTRMVSVVNEFITNEDLKDFFGLAEQEKKEELPTGPATESTEEDGH